MFTFDFRVASSICSSQIKKQEREKDARESFIDR